jgi:hypothetical protein
MKQLLPTKAGCVVTSPAACSDFICDMFLQLTCSGAAVLLDVILVTTYEATHATGCLHSHILKSIVAVSRMTCSGGAVLLNVGLINKYEAGCVLTILHLATWFDLARHMFDCV